MEDSTKFTELKISSIQEPSNWRAEMIVSSDAFDDSTNVQIKVEMTRERAGDHDELGGHVEFEISARQAMLLANYLTTSAHANIPQ
jgi:hypothetical protein